MRGDKQTHLFVWNVYACRFPVVPAAPYIFHTGTKKYNLNLSSSNVKLKTFLFYPRTNYNFSHTQKEIRFLTTETTICVERCGKVKKDSC